MATPSPYGLCNTDRGRRRYAHNLELPTDIEQQVRTTGADIDREARELYLVELYRQDRISHAQLREALGASFDEADRLIKAHGAGHDFPVDEFEKQRAFLREAKPR